MTIASLLQRHGRDEGSGFTEKMKQGPVGIVSVVADVDIGQPNQRRVPMRIGFGAIVSLVFAVGCKATDAKSARRSIDQVDTIVVNSVRPFALPVASTREASSSKSNSPIVFRRESGDSSLLANAHEILCSHRGDVTLRSGAEGEEQHILVRRRPVVAARLATPIQLVLGDSAQSLHVIAYDRDSQPVTLLSGTITTRDSTSRR